MRYGNDNHRRAMAVLVFAGSLCLMAPAPLFADGGGGGGGGGGADTSSAHGCGKGEYWSDAKGKCEKLRAGALSDKDLAQHVVALSRAKRYDEAMDALQLMQNRDDIVRLLPDADLAEYAIVLAKAKRYDDALAVLNRMKNPNTAVALNYRGYVTRHLGHIDEGIQYYLRSVKLDPRYAQVREYLGEAYVIRGDLASARYQLRKIKTICGNTECEEYEDLEKAIAGHPEDEG
jgi:tetratricopeptide (TPR) repeat protein